MFSNLFIKHPVYKGIYAVLKGTYSGEYIVYIKKEQDKFIFFSLPDKIILKVPESSFNNGFKNGIIDFIEKLPNKVYNVVESEYFNLNNNNELCRTEKNNKSDKREISRPENYNSDKRRANHKRGALV